MHPSQLIYQAKTKDIVLPDSRDKLCVLCGYPCDGSLLAKDVIKDTFNDLGYLTQPNSLYACIACAKCLDNGEDCLRRQTFFARVDTHNNEQEFINFSGEGVRGRVRDFVVAFDPTQVKGYWLLCITLTGQKHLSFKCVVNTGGGSQVYNIQLEEQSIRVNHQLLVHSLGNFELLLMPEFGLNKSEIASGEYPAGKLAKLMANGMYSEFEAIEVLLSEVRVKQPKLMELLGYLAQYSTPFEKVKTDKVTNKVVTGSAGIDTDKLEVSVEKGKGKTKSDSKTTKRTSGASGQPTLFDMEVS